MVTMSQMLKKAGFIAFSSIVLILVLLLLAFNCIMSNSSSSKESRIVPYDFPGSVWESEVPYIHLEVPNEPGESITGYYLVDNDIRTVTVVRIFYLDKYEKAITGGGLDTDAVLIKASCQYSDETILLRIKDDMIFNGEYETITLYKKPAG